MRTRRHFLNQAPIGLLGGIAACRGNRQGDGRNGRDGTVLKSTAEQGDGGSPAGAPPAWNTSPPVGPEIAAGTFGEAEKLMQVVLRDDHREMAARSWRTSMAPLLERRTGPRKVALEPELPPATTWIPAAPSVVGPSVVVPGGDRRTSMRIVRSGGSTRAGALPLPGRDEDIAHAPLTDLSRWIEMRRLSSERLTRIYLERIRRFDPQLRSVITLTAERALADAKAADSEIVAGRYRGPLHGIPYGVKDLLDTAGIATTYGAEPFRHRVPTTDATVIARLREAGAVLIAKLSLGALALNDVWFGGQTMNPWLLEEGASGSSAGPGAATAAALVGFSIGSETGGSIISPAMRCGVTGLRPTYGRVPRTGAMTLCWSLDKLGPMTRGVEDALLVLAAISGPDPGDVAGAAAPLEFDARAPVRGLRVGYVRRWMDEAPATDIDRAALEAVAKLGMRPTAITLPDWPYESLNLILFAEAAAAFEELTLDNRMDQLRMQPADAWPNLFREARFLSAVDFVQADRFRRKVAHEIARVMKSVDLLLVPSLRNEALVIFNNTGHPSLTLRAGFVEVSEARSDWAPDPARPLPHLSPPRRVPYGVTLIGHLFDEGRLAAVGCALERTFGVSRERPVGF